MNTDIHRSRISISAFIRGNSFRLVAMVWLVPLLLLGCKKEEPKTYPQDRLTVEYSIDRDTIHVGDPVALVVTAYYPTNGVIELPEIEHEKDVVVLNRNWTSIPRSDGLSQSEMRYSITSFRLGEHVVSTNRIACRVGDQTYTTNFPGIVLQVESSLPADATSELADIKPIQKLAGRTPRWIWIVWVAAVAAFLIGLAVSRLTRHKEPLVRVPPPVPPYTLAMHALEALRSKGLMEQDDCEPFFTELSMILRRYLDGRFHLNAPDETTEEIVEEMSRSPELSGAQRNILQEFMRQADMVKFARNRADRNTMDAAFDTTKKFVEETKPMPTEQD